MRAIFVLFGSLNRTALSCYGATAVKTPKFDRFARRAVTFDTHFVGSLPCMPPRRDLHTGRLNFMHRSWGPLELFGFVRGALSNERPYRDSDTRPTRRDGLSYSIGWSIRNPVH